MFGGATPKHGLKEKSFRILIFVILLKICYTMNGSGVQKIPNTFSKGAIIFNCCGS